MTPASITKLLTALVALKYCDPNQVLTFTDACVINENGAQKINLGVGDTLTMDQALNILLLYSANDVAMMIANNFDGGIIADAFQRRGIAQGEILRQLVDETEFAEFVQFG